jgi:hypothetical protein
MPQIPLAAGLHMPQRLKITSVGHELVVSCGSLLEIVEGYRSPLLCAVAFEAISSTFGNLLKIVDFN